jgi:hypothetical protein
VQRFMQRRNCVCISTKQKKIVNCVVSGALTVKRHCFRFESAVSSVIEKTESDADVRFGCVQARFVYIFMADSAGSRRSFCIFVYVQMILASSSSLLLLFPS